MARKARPRAMQPARCLSSFSSARRVKRAAASMAAAATYDGRRGHETVASNVRTGGERSKEVTTQSVFLPEVELEQLLMSLLALEMLRLSRLGMEAVDMLLVNK